MSSFEGAKNLNKRSGFIKKLNDCVFYFSAYVF